MNKQANETKYWKLMLRMSVCLNICVRDFDVNGSMLSMMTYSFRNIYVKIYTFLLYS